MPSLQRQQLPYSDELSYKNNRETFIQGCEKFENSMFSYAAIVYIFVKRFDSWVCTSG